MGFLRYFQSARRFANLQLQKLFELPLRSRLYIAVVLFSLIIIPIGIQYYHNLLYTVSDASRQLLTNSSVDVSKIKAGAGEISYHETDQKAVAGKQVTIAGPTDATGKTGYQATINTDFKKGLNFGDSGSELSFQMTPLFSASAGEYKDGQVLFPVSTTTKIIQTFKKNGLKEDIVLTKAPARTASWQWKLGLGDKLSVKLLPDGSVGVFAANPNLYGDIQINDAKSQALIDKARTTDKTYLLFVVPAPYIKNAKGQTLKEDVSFKLAGDILTLEARNLDNQHYPISIDPSVVVTTTADFATGMDDGMINYSTANQIGRSTISLGSVGTTTQQTNAFTTGRSGHTSVVYNGYVYIVGGTDGSVNLGDIQHCPINSNGSIGTCVQQINAYTTARYLHTSVVYNGYLYIIGGCSAGVCSFYENDIQHCPINSDGSVGTCVQQASAFTTARWYQTSVTYNGILYLIGGSNGTNQNDIQHCPINADGSVGTCVQQTSAFTTARSGHTSVAYNGFLYIMGGWNGSADMNDIQHCPINADGSVGTCVQQTSAFTGARNTFASVAYDGYVYIIGGGTNNDVQHCPINGDGSVGTCVQQTSAFTTGRDGLASVVYNGYVYVIGGNFSGKLNDIQYLPVNTGTPTGFGVVGATTQQAAPFTTARSYLSSVAYNGYLYIIGGINSAGVDQNDIQRCPLNTDGSLGTCVQQTNAFTTARDSQTAVVYNGYLHILGGYDSTVPTTLNDAQHCPISLVDGSVGTCVRQANAFTTPREAHGSAAYNGFLYIAGGMDTSGASKNDIQFAAIGSNGNLSCPTGYTCSGGTVFAISSTTFTNDRAGLGTVAYNGYLYMVGGKITSGSVLSDIRGCPINSDGNVGACVLSGSLQNARLNHTTVAYNGYMYAIGGDSTGYMNDIERCPFNSDGTIGTCVQQTSAFTTGRQNHASAAYNGYLYIAGGDQGTLASVDNDVQHLLVQSPVQAAHYERIVDVGVIADSIDSIQYNGTAKCGAGVQYATAGSNGIFGSLTNLAPDVLPGVATTLSGQTSKRYVKVIITLNDQNCGGTSTVTDITVNYTYSSLPPAAPTLSAPLSGAISIGLTPLFQLKTTDTLDNYVRYKILVYQSDCSTLVRTIDQTSSQTGWSGQDAQTSTAYTVGSSLGASTLASHTYQATALSTGTTYCWKAAAIDPAGSNSFGSYSATQLFTTNQTPTAPVLTQPVTGQTGVSTTPELRFYSTDGDSDYLRYKIDVCSTSNCSSIVRTIDQTSSQTGWVSQSQQSATAYTSGQAAVHTYQAAALSASTQYWWRAYAIDPAGNNTFSSASSISTFTTASSTQNSIIINGNTTINGNTKIGQ